jgi:hypothetical protein
MPEPAKRLSLRPFAVNFVVAPGAVRKFQAAACPRILAQCSIVTRGARIREISR